MKRDQRSTSHKKPTSIYTFAEADARLYDLFRHHGFADFPHSQRHQLVEYYLLLMNHQLTDNVTRLVKFRDIGIKHFIDSLMVPRLTTLRFPLLDIGSGAGFPGIPLKIMYPEEKIILAEGVRKRGEFLKVVRTALQLESLEVVGRKVDERFQLPVKGVITRALEDISGTLRHVSQCLEPGGHVYFMKGPNVTAEIKAAAANNHYELVEDHSYTLPNTPHDRRLVVYRKRKATL